MINNAAIDPKVRKDLDLDSSSRLESFDLSEWNKQIAVGLTGALNCIKIFGPDMAKSEKNCVILNIASDLSVIAPDQRIYKKKGISEESQQVKPVTYSVIKSGLVGLTKYVATYWSKQGVRCNALSPGGIKNNQSEEFISRINNLINRRKPFCYFYFFCVYIFKFIVNWDRNEFEVFDFLFLNLLQIGFIEILGISRLPEKQLINLRGVPYSKIKGS